MTAKIIQFPKPTPKPAELPDAIKNASKRALRAWRESIRKEVGI